MENQTRINIGMFLLIIAGFTTITVTDDRGIELESTHACLSKELKMYCDRLSGTGITCYPNELRIGYKRCSEGWKEIPEIIEPEPILQPEIKLEPIKIKESTSKRLHCNKDDCF